jgi:hypothetical protein
MDFVLFDPTPPDMPRPWAADPAPAPPPTYQGRCSFQITTYNTETESWETQIVEQY